MFSIAEVRHVPLFTSAPDGLLNRLLSGTADVRLRDGEWLIREGESPHFFILIEGSVELVKDFNGKEETVMQYGKDDFFGEIPILLDSSMLASVRATAVSRILRLTPLQLRLLIDEFPGADRLILRSMTERLRSAQKVARGAPRICATVVGARYDHNCRRIRAFLSSNRIPYRWIDEGDRTDSIAEGADRKDPSTSVVVEGIGSLEQPTLSELAAALGYQTAPRADQYDVVIIGAGPSGLAAAVYGASEGLRTLVVEKNRIGGQAGTSSRIENYLGFPNGISGDELSERAKKQATRLGAEIILTREVSAIDVTDHGYDLHLDGGGRVKSHCVVLATGVAWRTLDVPGIDRLQGRGILYGASRMEAGSVVGKDVFIVGGGNSAGQAALFFADYARTVTILVRGSGLDSTMSSYLIEQIKRCRNILTETSTRIISASGEQILEHLCTVRHEEPAKNREAHALFIMIGADADTSWIDGRVSRDEKGFVYTGRDIPKKRSGGRDAFLLETSLPGVFCVGDVRHNSVKRVAAGVGEGSMAIAFVHQFLAMQEQESDHLCPMSPNGST